MNTHRIHRVAKLTGLSRDVIRVWERRFGLLKPTRGANRYRNYSDEDVALLRYLKQQLDAGASIGDLAKLGREELITRLRTEAPRLSEEPKAPVAMAVDRANRARPPLKTVSAPKAMAAIARILKLRCWFMAHSFGGE